MENPSTPADNTASESNHVQHVKRVLIQDLFNEISSPRYDLQLSSYSQGFILSVINPKGSRCPNKEEKLQDSV
jgi:hypothetical protein